MGKGILVLFFLASLAGSTALAQADPTSTFLLNFGSPAPEEAGLESGRYQSRPQPPPAQPPARETLPHRPVLRAPEPPAPEEEPAPEPEPEESPLDLELMKPQSSPPSEGPGLDFEISSLVQYSSSNSPSWYRSYHSPGLGVRLAGSVWLTSDWAFSGFFAQSLGERVSDSYQSPRFVGQTRQDTGLGFSSRLGSSRQGAELGLFYYERRRSVDKEARMQSDWITQGLLLSIKYRWQKQNSGGYLDFKIYPRASHRDGATSGFGLGEHAETYGGKIRLGRSVHLTESNRLFFGVGAQVEQNRFSGKSSLIEPDGNRVDGVYSLHSSVFLEFGLGWSQ